MTTKFRVRSIANPQDGVNARRREASFLYPDESWPPREQSRDGIRALLELDAYAGPGRLERDDGGHVFHFVLGRAQAAWFDEPASGTESTR